MILLSVHFWLERERTKADQMQSYLKEKAAFSLSTAVLFTLAHNDPGKVRGILGRLIHKVLQ